MLSGVSTKVYKVPIFCWFAGPFWVRARRITSVSKWLIRMFSKSPKWGYSPSKWPKLLINGGLLLTTYKLRWSSKCSLLLVPPNKSGVLNVLIVMSKWAARIAIFPTKSRANKREGGGLAPSSSNLRSCAWGDAGIVIFTSHIHTAVANTWGRRWDGGPIITNLG